MKKLFLVLTAFLMLQSCLDFRPCKYKEVDVVGRYYCYNNENALNWLDIHKDGTFEHYYTEGDIKLSHSGTWEKSEKNTCVIELTRWKSFNERGLNYETYIKSILYMGYNYLDIGPDGESNTSFEKSGEDMSVNPLELIKKE
ncbi:MAG: hypothetical protein GKR88_21275 [Flavobacteriaceae bacterium]|nr:MAG: hypothetical protein GKR88_21275 [Flavobacteriaceae bacterium]